MRHRGRPIVVRTAAPTTSASWVVAGSAATSFAGSTAGGGSFLYVNADTGDDSRTRAQAANAATPWQTIGRAVWGSTTRASPNSAQAAQAGDTVLVSAGTYWASPQCTSSLDVWYSPVNAGTLSAPLTIQAQGTVHLASSGPRACGPLMGSAGRAYVIWDGFTIEGDAAPPCGDSGLAVVVDAVGCQIRRSVLRGSGWAIRSAKTGGGNTYHELLLPVTITSSTAGTPAVFTAPAHGIAIGAFNDHAIRIDGHTDTLLNGEWFARALTANTFELHRNLACTDPVTGVGGTGGTITLLRLDNHSPIFASSAHQLRVSDCHLSRAWGYGENTSGAILYTTWGSVFENCECDTFEGYGIFFKGMAPEQVAAADTYGPTIVRDCYIHDAGQGGIFQGDLPCTDATRLLIYRNLITHPTGQGRGFQCLGLTDAARAPRHAWLVNNVFDHCQAGIVLRGVNDTAAGFQSQGNILVNCDRAYEWWLGSPLTVARFDVEHDVVFANTAVMVIDPEGAAITYTTVAAFQGAYPHIGSATPTIATTDPLFTNPAARDYTLQGGSPALNQSRSSNGLWGADGTIIHAGLYPTTVVVTGRSTFELPTDRMTLWQPGVTYTGGIPTRSTFQTLTPTGTTDTAQIQAAVNACPSGSAVELAAGTFVLAAGTSIKVKSGVTVRGQGMGVTTITRTATDRAIRKFPDAYVMPSGGYPFFLIADNPFLHWRVSGDAVNLTAVGQKGAYGIRVDPAVNLASKGIVVGAQVVLDEDHFYTGAWVDLPLTSGATNPYQVWQSDRVSWSRYRRRQGPQAVVSSDAGTNRLTVTGHPFQAGDGIYLTGHSATFSPAYSDGRYYVASGAGDDPDANTFKLRVWGGANHGTLVDITAGGSGGTAEAYMVFTDFDPGPTSTIAAYGGSGEQPGNALGWFGRGGGRYLGEVKKIRAITGNYIEFETPLHIAYRPAYGAQICAADAPLVTDVGIESMSLVGGSDGAIQFQYAAKSWVKNVEIDEWLGHAIELKMAYRCEVTGCYIHDAAWPVPGGAGYGVVWSFHASECLLEDTTIIGSNKLMAGNSGGTACVVASCYLDDAQIWNLPQAGGSGTWSEVHGNMAHNNAPHHALLTDCWSANFDSDNTHGSSAYHTHYRNRAGGFRRNKVEFAGNNNQRCLGLGYGARWMSFVGNVLGETGRMAGWIYEVPANVVFNSQPPSVLKFSYSTGDWNQYRWETQVQLTLLAENYDHLRVQRNNATLQTLPDSLYAPVKPAYYGATPWPPANPLTGTMATIPALARYNALHPGKRQWTNFNMPNGAIDGDWTVWQGGWTVVSNQLTPTNASHNAAAHSYMPMAAAQYAEVRIVTAGVGGPAVRMGSGPNYYYATVQSSSCTLAKCVSGTHTTLATFSGIGTTGRLARLEMVGTTLTLRYDGSVIGSTTDSSLTSGSGGLYSSGTVPVFDDFACGEL